MAELGTVPSLEHDSKDVVAAVLPGRPQPSAVLLLDTPFPRTALASGWHPYRDLGKRLLDVVLSSILLVALTPLILIVAVVVTVITGWPPFYSAKRVGKDGREFSMFKIRTMVRDADRALEGLRLSNPNLAAEYAHGFKLKDDPRVTKLGRLLRRTSLDELPQLFNVLLGGMSMVGPRPYFRRELSLFPQASDSITSVRPGVTGPWQTRGRNSLPPQMRVQLDQDYVETCSLAGDVRCLIGTVKALTRMDGM